MTIERNGQLIELTADELLTAYYEQEHNYDVQDVEDEIETCTDDELLDMYGAKREDLLPLVDEMAYRKRRNIEKYEMEWFDAVAHAIREVWNREKCLRTV